jgi:hypothetical protein
VRPLTLTGRCYIKDVNFYIEGEVKGFTRSPSGDPSLEGMRGKHLEGKRTAVPILSAASSRGWIEGRPRQAPHQANGLADDPGKGRHSDAVRGMEVKMIPSLFVFS